MLSLISKIAYAYTFMACCAVQLLSAEPKASDSEKVDEKAIRAELEKMGCTVDSKGLDPTQPIFAVTFEEEKFKTGDVAKAIPLLKKITELRDIAMWRSGTDNDLKALAELKESKKLEAIKVLFCEITDDGLLHLKTLPHLKTLNLVGSNKVTPAGVRKAFEAIPTLEKVYLKADDGLSRDSK